MKKYFPIALTSLRLGLGPVVLACALAQVPRMWFLPILLVGTVSDIFDGVLARRWGVVTPGTARYDSITDLIYYGFVVAATWICAGGILMQHWPVVAALVLAEATCLGVSFAKFGCYPSVHSYLAKCYGLALFVTFVALLGFGGPTWILPVLAFIGLAADLEIVAILLLADKPPVNVWSIFHLDGKLCGTAERSVLP